MICLWFYLMDLIDKIYKQAWTLLKTQEINFPKVGGLLAWWVGRLEKVEIKPSQPAGAGAWLSLAIVNINMETVLNFLTPSCPSQINTHV